MKLSVGAAWHTVSLEVADAPTGRLLRSAFEAMVPDCSATSRGPVIARVSQSRGMLRVTSEYRTLHCRSPQRAAVEVATVVNQRLLDSCPHLACHAAVLAAGDAAIAIPAESGAGKSTLAAACVRAGFTYVSDEALVLGPRGEVVPYPRPLGLSAWSRAAIGLQAPVWAADRDDDEVLVPPYDLGSVAQPSAPLRLGAVVVPHRLRGCTEPRFAALPTSEGAIALLRNCFNHYRWPASAVERTMVALGGAGVFEVALVEPVATAALLVELFLT